MTQLTEKSRIWHANWGLIILTALLVIFGLVNLYSACATRGEYGVDIEYYYTRQLGFAGLGLLCMVFAMAFDYRRLERMAVPFFVCSIILLLLVPFFGREVKGAVRWIPLFGIRFQPSELAKISVMVLAAKLLSTGRGSLGWKDFIKVCAVGLLPCLIVFIQPDLGTAVIILAILGGMIIFRGLKSSIVKVVLCLLLLSPFFLWKAVYPNLKPYQQQRIVNFINPSAASQDAMYQRNQALIAIGSGQLWGKGWMEGPQNNLNYIPERHTDYAIAVLGEEHGFAGIVLLVGLFSLFLLSICATAANAKDRFGSYLCAGVFFSFFWQIFINIGMVAGMLPVVGVPLPFFSHGGTAMVVNFSLLGIVLSVSMRRFVFKAA
ncbi:MAG: rod shape-determining protein RodA [Deltaproteobacteria bacterium]|jgi:rod shape determining protein RodA|nr:rod shape-determining protein RodA [Deltaproteobacteria bacterium]